MSNGSRYHCAVNADLSSGPQRSPYAKCPCQSVPAKRLVYVVVLGGKVAERYLVLSLV